MTSCHKIARLALAVLMLSLPMFGQYTGTPSPGVFDGTQTSCTTTSCWYALPGSLDTISAGTDGTLCGVNGSNKVYCWDSSTLAWFEETALEVGSTTSYVGVGNARSVVVLTTAPSDNVYYFNGSTLTKVAGGGYCNQVGLGGGNTDLWCLQGTYVYHFNGSGWTLNSGRLSNLSVSSTSASSFIYGVNSSNVLYGWTGTAWNAATGLGFTPSSAPGAVSGGSDGSIAVIDTNGELHISEDGGGTWSTVASPPATDQLKVVSSPSLFQLVAVNTSNNIFHYNGLIPAMTQTTSGSYSGCPGCTPPGYHTGTSSASFPHGLNAGSSQVQTPFNNQMNVSHQDYSPNCDPIFTFGNPECNAALSSTVTCPIMGQLLNVSEQPTVEYAATLGKYAWIGVSQNPRIYPITKITTYDYLVDPWCSNGTPSPVLNVVTDTSSHPYWNTIAFYEGYAGHWHLLGAPGIGTTSTTKGSCSSLP